MTVPRVGASRARTLAVPCVLTPQLPPCAIPHLTPDTLSILSLLACHPLLTRLSSLSRRTFHPFVVSTPALSNLATFPLATCALKRFPLTSPRKLALTCVKRGFLRTAEPHRTLQISPCAPLCRSAMSMRCLAVMCHAPAPPHHRHLPRAKSCLALFPNPTTATLRHRTSDPDALSILSLLAFHHSHQALAVTLSFPHPPSPILATFLSMVCVLKRFPLTSPRKLALPCVKRGFLRTAEPH